MKQKFTLNIADIQISVIADAAPEEVEHIRGLLDRKMREIYLKSRCPKTEAARLCAKDFAADRMNLQAQITELDERCEKYALVLENLKERNADQNAELERLRSENAVLRSLLTKDVDAPVAPDPISPADFFAEVAAAQTQAGNFFADEDDEEETATAQEEAPAEEASAEEIPAVEETAEAASEEAEIVVEQAEPAPAEEETLPEKPVAETPVEAPVAEPAPVEPAPVTPRPRSRVGNMFRHLSFGDVD